MPRREGARTAPLSFSQHQLWFLEQWKPGAATYNVTTALRLRGDLDESALESALRSLIERHEALRTSFVLQEGEPVQLVRDSWEFELARVDLREHDSATREEECQRHLNELMQLPFELSSDLMLRATLIKLDAAEQVLVVQSHHIACDGWSEAVLFDELKELYDAHRSESDVELPGVAFQYTDFASWQRGRLSGDVLGDQLAYWRQELSGAPTAIDLADRPRPAVQTFVGRNLFLSMPRDMADGVRDLAQAEGVTPFMLLLAAFATVLYRRSGQDDILIGSPFANRSRREFERMIGFVSNTTVLRARLGGNPTFRELLARIRETTVGALAHQETPFEKVVEALAPQRDPGVNPLFQVNFRALSEPSPPELSGLAIERLQVDSGTTRFDLALELQLREDGIGGFLKYNTDLFEAATIDRIAADLESLLAEALAQPETRLLALSLASELRPAEQAIGTRGNGIRGFRERTSPVSDSGRRPADPSHDSRRREPQPVTSHRPAVVLGFNRGALGVVRGLGRAGLPVVGIGFQEYVGSPSRYFTERLVVARQRHDGALDMLQALEKVARRGRPVVFPATEGTVSWVIDNWDRVRELADVSLPDDVETIRRLRQEGPLGGSGGASGRSRADDR